MFDSELRPDGSAEPSGLAAFRAYALWRDLVSEPAGTPRERALEVSLCALVARLSERELVDYGARVSDHLSRRRKDLLGG